MKKKFAAIGLMIALMLAGTSCRNAGHDRDLRDSGWMIRMRMGQAFWHHRSMSGMRGMMGQGMRFGRNRGMHSGMGTGMMRGMERMPMDSIGFMPFGTGRRLLESIPNVTDNQKKQMEDIIKKRNDDLKKLREETFSKMKDIVAANRKEMLNVLTDDQKKFLESERGKATPSDVTKK
jgi:hypothetical protein